MRVITGSARGKKLITLEGNDIRPTTDRVKEALFSSIHFNLEGAKVLDLFAGCGQLGIEALSRGASFALFCDNLKQAVDTIKRNVENCGFDSSAYHILRTDAISFLSAAEEKFDICFIDPPYYAGLYTDVLQKIERVMKKGSILICEHPLDIKLLDSYGNFIKKKEYRFSKIVMTKYVWEVPEDE